MNWPDRSSFVTRFDSQPRDYPRPVTELLRSASLASGVTNAKSINDMKLIELINGEPRMRWYVAIALLFPILLVVIGLTFAPLLIFFGPLSPAYRFPVWMAAGTIGVSVSLFLWRFIMLRMLRRAVIVSHPTSMPTPK